MLRPIDSSQRFGFYSTFIQYTLPSQRSIEKQSRIIDFGTAAVKKTLSVSPALKFIDDGGKREKKARIGTATIRALAVNA